MTSHLKADLQQIYATQLEKVLIFRNIFGQINDAWGCNKDEENAADLGWFMHDGYVAYACLAVRRMMDSDPNSVSLLNFLKDLKRPSNLSLLGRADYCRAHVNPRHPKNLAEKDYDEVTDGDPELTTTRIDSHISALKTATAPVEKLVNKVIAHTDKTHKGSITFGELNGAIDASERVFNRYHLLINGTSLDLGYIERSLDVASDVAKIWS